MTNPVQGSSFQQTVTGCKVHPDKKVPKWALDAKFVNMLHSVQSTNSFDRNEKGHTAIQQLLQQADTLEAASQMMCEALVQRLSKLLIMSAKGVDIKKPIVACGLDFSATVELRHWITGEVRRNVP